MTVIVFDTSNSKINILNLGHCVLTINMLLIISTEDPKYNNSVCYQRFCCKIEFAVIKKLDMDPCKA